MVFRSSLHKQSSGEAFGKGYINVHPYTLTCARRDGILPGELVLVLLGLCAIFDAQAIRMNMGVLECVCKALGTRPWDGIGSLCQLFGKYEGVKSCQGRPSYLTLVPVQL